MSKAMEKFWEAKAKILQSQIDRIGDAYCKAETDHDFSEAVFLILQEGPRDQ